MGNWDVKLDGNKAIEQMDELGKRVWDTFKKPSTAVAVELMNESSYDLRHIGNFRWQGSFMQPEDDVPAGYGRAWGMESTGIDGSFGAVTYQLWQDGAATKAYLVIGNLLYWDGAQPHYTVELTTTDYYNDEGKPKTLDLLNHGKSSSWTKQFDDIGGVSLTFKVDIWHKVVSEPKEYFRIQMTPGQ